MSLSTIVRLAECQCLQIEHACTFNRFHCISELSRKWNRSLKPVSPFNVIMADLPQVCVPLVAQFHITHNSLIFKKYIHSFLKYPNDITS